MQTHLSDKYGAELWFTLPVAPRKRAALTVQEFNDSCEILLTPTDCEQLAAALLEYADLYQGE